MHLTTGPACQQHDVPLRATLFLIIGLLSAFLLYAAVRLEIEPMWILAAIFAAFLAAVLVERYPVALMVALVYVGTFKTQGAAGVTLTDPTLITAVLLYAAVMLHVLLSATGLGNYSLRDLFVGQIGGVSAFCLVVFVIAISYLYTPAPAIGADKVTKLAVFDLPIFLAPLVLLRTERGIRHLILLSILASLALACRAAYRLLHPTADMLLGNQDPTEIGEGLLTGAAVLLALYYPFRVTRLFRAMLIASIVVLALGTTVSISRSAILSLLLVGTGSVILLRPSAVGLSRKTILIAAAAIAIAISAAMAWLGNLPAAHSKFGEKAQELRLTLNGMDRPSGTAGQRFSFAQSAWQAFLARPWLGWGAGGWSTLFHYSDERILKYPHNFVLEIAAEQGLVGLAALFCMFVAILHACNKVLRSAGNRFVFIVPVVALTLLGNAVTGQIDSRDMWFWCGVLFALARMASAKPAVPRPQLNPILTPTT